MQIFPPCPIEELARQTKLILSSYRRLKAKHLWREDLPDPVLAREVFNAPFVLVSSGAEEDPILNYGNQQALKLWEMDWETLTRTPGRNTAEAMEREARDRFLETVKKQGYIDDYRGIRISQNGRRFEIERATVWNLTDELGRYAGQAATFSSWKPL